MTRYEIVIDGITKVVDFERATDRASLGTEEYRCQILGKGSSVTRKLIVEKRDPRVLLVSLDEKIYSLIQTRRTSTGIEFLVNGKEVRAHFPVERESEATSVKSDIASVTEIVSANFPAKVLSIKASKGDKLKAGETLLILEAMKMEAQIKAPRDCEVSEIYVREGEMVPRGAKLAHLKFA